MSSSTAPRPIAEIKDEIRAMMAERRQLDDRDVSILAERVAALAEVQGPRVGDWVIFADGVTRRISYIWCDVDIQTSDGGSYYLGSGYVSMSGSLHTSVKAATLTLTEDTRPGAVWFFHHDWAQAGGGVDTMIDFRVYTCTENAPR